MHLHHEPKKIRILAQDWTRINDHWRLISFGQGPTFFYFYLSNENSTFARWVHTYDEYRNVLTYVVIMNEVRNHVLLCPWVCGCQMINHSEWASSIRCTAIKNRRWGSKIGMSDRCIWQIWSIFSCWNDVARIAFEDVSQMRVEEKMIDKKDSMKMNEFILSEAWR